VKLEVGIVAGFCWNDLLAWVLLWEGFFVEEEVGIF
jgi:hypothetical protein